MQIYFRNCSPIFFNSLCSIISVCGHLACWDLIWSTLMEARHHLMPCMIIMSVFYAHVQFYHMAYCTKPSFGNKFIHKLLTRSLHIFLFEHLFLDSGDDRFCSPLSLTFCISNMFLYMCCISSSIYLCVLIFFPICPLRHAAWWSSCKLFQRLILYKCAMLLFCFSFDAFFYNFLLHHNIAQAFSFHPQTYVLSSLVLSVLSLPSLRFCWNAYCCIKVQRVLSNWILDPLKSNEHPSHSIPDIEKLHMS